MLVSQENVIELMRDRKWWTINELAVKIFGKPYRTKDSQYKTIIHFLGKMNKKGELDKKPYGLMKIQYRLREGI